MPPAAPQAPEAFTTPEPGAIPPSQEVIDQEFWGIVEQSSEENLSPEITNVQEIQMIGRYMREIRQTQGFDTPGTDPSGRDYAIKLGKGE